MSISGIGTTGHFPIHRPHAHTPPNPVHHSNASNPLEGNTMLEQMAHHAMVVAHYEEDEDTNDTETAVEHIYEAQKTNR